MGFDQAGSVIKLSVSGFQRFHIIRRGMGTLRRQTLPSPQQQPGSQPAKRRCQCTTPWRQCRGSIHQTAAFVAEEYPLQQIHGVAEYSNGQRGQHASDGGNQESAKHRSDVRVSVKTLHGPQLNRADTVL